LFNVFDQFSGHPDTVKAYRNTECPEKRGKNLQAVVLPRSNETEADAEKDQC
jgi:hypothetical protein